MRCFLFAALFCACLCSAQAQTAPDTARRAIMPSNVAPLARADTAQAVHRLFKKQRVGGGYFILGGVLTVPASFVVWLFSNGIVPSGNKAPNDTPFVVGVGIGAGAVAVGTVKIASFSKGKEREVLAAYEQGRPLPAAIRKKLVLKAGQMNYR